MRPAVRDVLWPLLSPLFHQKSCIQLDNERSYRAVEAGINEDLIVSGNKDHSVVVRGSDIEILLIKDKAILQSLNSKRIAAQVTSQVVSAAQTLVTVGTVSREVCALAQNGSVWRLYRRTAAGTVIGVDAPAIFTASSTEISRSNCAFAARLIEHALCVANDILDTVADDDVEGTIPSHQHKLEEDTRKRVRSYDIDTGDGRDCSELSDDSDDEEGVTIHDLMDDDDPFDASFSFSVVPHKK